MESDEVGGLGQCPAPFRAEGPADRRPDPAQDLVAGPDRDSLATDVGGLPGREVDRLARALEALEHTLSLEPAQDAFRYSAAQDGVDPRLVGLLLAIRVGDHPRLRVLDG